MTQKPYANTQHLCPGEGRVLWISDEARDLALIQIGGFLQETGFPVFTPEEPLAGDALELCDGEWAKSQIRESQGDMRYEPIWSIGQIRDLLDGWYPA